MLLYWKEFSIETASSIFMTFRSSEQRLRTLSIDSPRSRLAIRLFIELNHPDQGTPAHAGTPALLNRSPG